MNELEKDSEVVADRLRLMDAVWRFVCAAIVMWMILSLVLTTLIPVDYLKEMGMASDVEVRIVSALVIGSLSGAALDTVQWRRRQMKKASMPRSQKVRQ